MASLRRRDAGVVWGMRLALPGAEDEIGGEGWMDRPPEERVSQRAVKRRIVHAGWS